jgi:hypothetical protein
MQTWISMAVLNSPIIQSREQYGQWFKSHISSTLHLETIQILDEETTISLLPQMTGGIERALLTGSTEATSSLASHQTWK